MTTVVVGAGLSGLVRAHALAERGEDVLLLEQSDRAGGVVRSVESDGYLLELGPNTVRPTRELWSLVVGLGLEAESLLADPRTPRYVDFGGALHRLPMSPAGLVRTRLLSARGKLRLAAEPFVRRGNPSRDTVREFFTRRLGPEFAERIVEPFVSGIWGGRSDGLSLEQAFPQLARFEREFGSLTRGAIAAFARRSETRSAGNLLSFRSGLETLPRRLAEKLGVRSRFGERIEKVTRADRGWRVSTGRDEIEADRICLATPAPETARLVGEIAPEAATALATIPHAPLVVVHLASPGGTPLRGFGHLVVPQPGRRILGAVWSSNLFPGRAPLGRALFTVFLGGARDPGALELSDDELIALCSRDLAAVLAIPAALEPLRVTRYARAIPQYDMEHGKRMDLLAETERRLPGLSFIGSYRGGISVGDVVRSALAV